MMASASGSVSSNPTTQVAQGWQTRHTVLTAVGVTALVAAVALLVFSQMAAASFAATLGAGALVLTVRDWHVGATSATFTSVKQTELGNPVKRAQAIAAGLVGDAMGFAVSIVDNGQEKVVGVEGKSQAIWDSVTAGGIENIAPASLSDESYLSLLTAQALNDPLVVQAKKQCDETKLTGDELQIQRALNYFDMVFLVVSHEKMMVILSDPIERSYGEITLRRLSELNSKLPYRYQYSVKKEEHAAELAKISGDKVVSYEAASGQFTGDTVRAARLNILKEYFKDDYTYYLHGHGAAAAVKAQSIGLAFPREEDTQLLVRTAYLSAMSVSPHPTGCLGAVATACLFAMEARGVPIEEWGPAIVALRPQIQEFIVRSPLFDSPTHLRGQHLNGMEYFFTTWAEVLTDFGMLKYLESCGNQPTHIRFEDLKFDFRDKLTYRFKNLEQAFKQTPQEMQVSFSLQDAKKSMAAYAGLGTAGQSLETGICWKDASPIRGNTGPCPGTSGHDAPLIALLALMVAKKKCQTEGRETPQDVFKEAFNIGVAQGYFDSDTVGAILVPLICGMYGSECLSKRNRTYMNKEDASLVQKLEKEFQAVARNYAT